jgi:adenosylcobinamide-GDP ribazoletransferase
VILRPALVAVQFLTCIPVRLEPRPAGREVGLSLPWYPAVGLLIGVTVWVAASLSSHLPTLLGAALVLAVWLGLTGVLHLEGFADVADAWVGGHGDRERTLAIMKDTHVGPVAVAALVCLLLIKFGALAALLAGTAAPWSDVRCACGCIVPPLLARAAVPVLFAHTPYVRAQGIGADLAEHQSRAAGLWTAAGSVVAVLMVCGRAGLVAAASAVVVYLLMRTAFVRRLGGVTGDCIGAMIEVIEALALAAIVSS